MKILGKWAEFTQGTWCSLSPHLKLWNQDGDSCPPFLKSSSNMDAFDFSLCHFFSNLHKYKYATLRQRIDLEGKGYPGLLQHNMGALAQ